MDKTALLAALAPKRSARHNEHLNPGSRETARKEIGDLFADGEQPSTGTGK